MTDRLMDRLVRTHSVQFGWAFACFGAGIIGSLIGGFLGHLIF